MSHRLVLGGTTQLQSTDPRAERTITSFMREADNNDVGNSDSTGGVSNDVHSSNGLNDGETDGEGPDERAARSELAHSHVLRGFSLERNQMAQMLQNSMAQMLRQHLRSQHK